MTVEGSQSPQGAAPAQGTQGATRQPMGSQQMRIAALVVVAAVVGVVLWLVLRDNKKHHPGKGNNVTSALGPMVLTAPELRAEALALGQPLYWAGPISGFRYLFQRTTNGRLYVSYLPKGAPRKGARHLIVATYPWPHAFQSLKKGTHGQVRKGPGGSIFWVRPNNPRSILVAWPRVPYEVEVYDPSPAKAAAVAESGQLVTVG